MHNIPVYKQFSGEKKIALMDNSTVSFLEKMERYGISATRELLRGYDVIFIPGWVLEEVNASPYRSQYIENLISDGFPIYSIAEDSYAQFVDGEEGNLYKIVNAAVSMLGILKSYLRRNVQKEDPIDIVAYSDWITDMYNNWPLSDINTDTNHKKKKNAGEVSLTILAEIISWYRPESELITVFTQDCDSYNYQTEAHKQLKKVFFDRTPVDVSFKSNDFLLYQMYKNKTITQEKINEVRKDERTVIFTRKRADQSTALVTKKLNNSQYIELLGDGTVQIIF